MVEDSYFTDLQRFGVHAKHSIGNNSNDKQCEEKKDSYSDETKKGIKRMKKNFNRNAVVESSPGNKYTSYSINKGEKLVFCLRSKEDDSLVDLNTMMFVAIHELAHLMSESIGHTKEFWDNMKFLLERGIEINVYTKQDFNTHPKEYCGTQITDTPLNS